MRKPPPHAEHSRQKADSPTHGEGHQDVDRRLSDGEIDAHRNTLATGAASTDYAFSG